MRFRIFIIHCVAYISHGDIAIQKMLRHRFPTQWLEIIQIFMKILSEDIF
jgi:hypothetical protein